MRINWKRLKCPGIKRFLLISWKATLFYNFKTRSLLVNHQINKNSTKAKFHGPSGGRKRERKSEVRASLKLILSSHTLASFPFDRNFEWVGSEMVFKEKNIRLSFLCLRPACPSEIHGPSDVDPCSTRWSGLVIWIIRSHSDRFLLT